MSSIEGFGSTLVLPASTEYDEARIRRRPTASAR